LAHVVMPLLLPLFVNLLRYSYLQMQFFCGVLLSHKKYSAEDEEDLSKRTARCLL
jgi:hypothetical protein